MSVRAVVIIVLGLLIAVALGAVAALFLGGGFDLTGEEPYYAVQMENGDLYFGKITRFPKFGLRDAYIPQSVSDPTNPLGSSLRVVSLSQVSIWKASEIQLNKDKVLSISKVAEDSQVIQAIKGQ
ncbi:MAG: hypothetical protein HYW38_02190 [Candidatus Colwellbacteria bacterium]|nr:hypothetical protein [Candidatus Colwellbacteria bacterium]